MNKIMLLPNIKRKVGKKLKISDNLAAHISLAVDQPLPRKDKVSCLQRRELQPLDMGGVWSPQECLEENSDRLHGQDSKAGRDSKV
jgi:hypothetical protein